MLDLAYTSMDLRYAWDEEVADRFCSTYLAESGRDDGTLRHYELQALSRPIPDIAPWVVAWQALGLDLVVEVARARHLELIRGVLG